MESIGSFLLILGPILGIWLVIQGFRENTTKRILKGIIGLLLLVFPVFYFSVGNNSYERARSNLTGHYYLVSEPSTTLNLTGDSEFILNNDNTFRIGNRGKWQLISHDFDQLDLEFENGKTMSFEVLQERNSIALRYGITTKDQRLKFLKRGD